MSKNKVTTLVSAVFASSVLLSGCGLFGTEVQKKIDPPKSVTVDTSKTSTDTSGKKDPSQQTADQKDTSKQTIKTELYLIDNNGYVVPRTLDLPKTTSVATQALQYLVADGPVTNMLPNDFRAVLPQDTKVSVNIKDGVATVDFSKEFSNYKPEDEQKILQSVTWTLTQFDTVQQVKLQMNGHQLTEMPVKGTPISDKLNRKIGINFDNSAIADITNTRPLTVYYIGGKEGAYYYVPVTRRISNSEKDNVAAVVKELVNGPSGKSNLASEFMPDVKLLDTPKLDGGKVTLNFNENIFGGQKENVVPQSLLEELVLSLTEQQGIQKVAVMVKGKASLVDDSGKKLTEPVSRPEKVNTGSF